MIIAHRGIDRSSKVCYYAMIQKPAARVSTYHAFDVMSRFTQIVACSL